MFSWTPYIAHVLLTPGASVKCGQVPLICVFASCSRQGPATLRLCQHVVAAYTAMLAAGLVSRMLPTYCVSALSTALCLWHSIVCWLLDASDCRLMVVVCQVHVVVGQQMYQPTGSCKYLAVCLWWHGLDSLWQLHAARCLAAATVSGG